VFKYDYVNLEGQWERTMVGKMAMPFFALTDYTNPVAVGAMLANYVGTGYQTLALGITDQYGITLHYFNFNYLTDYSPAGMCALLVVLMLLG